MRLQQGVIEFVWIAYENMAYAVLDFGHRSGGWGRGVGHSSASSAPGLDMQLRPVSIP